MLTQSIRIRLDTGHQRASLQDGEMCRGEIAQYGEVAGSRSRRWTIQVRAAEG